MGNPSQRPKIFRGAFVEYGPKKQRPMVEFQFNPEELSRNRSLSFAPPNQKGRRGKLSLRDFHQRQTNLNTVRRKQQVTIEEETISFDIRLDATDGLSRGDQVVALYGVGPELAALELLTIPHTRKKGGDEESDEIGISFSRKAKPPMVLFVWGRRKVLPVNINSLAVKETEFSHDLVPTRAVVSVQMTVIEGPNSRYKTAFKTSLAEAGAALPDLQFEEVKIPPQ